MIPASELDELLLSFCDRHWRKVARIAGQALQALERRGVELDGSFADQIDARMAVLVASRQLEAAGNIKRWRYSEVRLPGAPVAAGE